MSTPAGHKSDRSMPFFPNFLLRDVVGWLAALAVLAALAAVFPWELGEKADPFASAPKGIRPEWFFVWMFQTLKIVPSHIWSFEGEQVAILGFGLLLILIAVVPLVDAGNGRRSLARLFTFLGWVLLFYVLVMTMSGYLETPVFAAGLPQAEPKNSCITCHSQLDGEAQRVVSLFEADIHRERGLSCVDCHGGDATRGDDGDMLAAMDPARGYIGAPAKKQIGAFCARCHSDLNYMRRFNPQMRVDQFAEYQTSVHGMRNAKGDPNPATCISCHSVHDIRSVRNPKAPVYPSEVAATCAKCHSDAKLMAGYHIPTDQFEKYRKSIHAKFVIDQRDFAAPTCNNCHGNHGARPPGVDSVPNVCGQCHRQENELFGKSPHREPFQAMGLAGCVVCHENHEVRKTDDRMLGTQPGAVCSACHSEGDTAADRIRAMQTSILGLRLKLDTTSEILGRAERAGMEVSKPKFDLHEANAELIKARVSVHAFNPEAVAGFTGPAMKLMAAARTTADAALEEIALRRRGLGYALIGIAIMIVAIVMKIREMEK